MSERSERIIWFLNRPYGIDEKACLCYGEAGEKRLKPCEPIQDGDLCLGIIDNSILKPSRLMFFPKDRLPVKVTDPSTGDTKELNLPGKSALIVLQPNLCDSNAIKDMVVTNFGFNPKRGRYIHVGCVSDIKNAGWVPYWAPLQLEQKFLHVRLVPKRTILTGEDPTESDLLSLLSVLERA